MFKPADKWSIRLALVGDTSMLCENDAIANSSSSVTIICRSQVGWLL